MRIYAKNDEKQCFLHVFGEEKGRRRLQKIADLE